MRKRIRSKHSTAGFTLLEVLVVVIIIGVLAAIAAPGWNAFLNRQRVTTAREQVLQVIRQAQDEAKRTSSARIVVFDSNSGSPRVAFFPFEPGVTNPAANPASISTNWQLLGNGNIRSGILQMTTKGTYSAIVFDARGAVATKPEVPSDQFTTLSGPSARGFAVTISQSGTTGSGTNRCIIIQTLLGATRLAEGSDCPS